MLLFILLLPLLLLIPLVLVLVQQRRTLHRVGKGGANASLSSKKLKVYGFFHPYCSGGGGGERVLWKMIQVLQQQQEKGCNKNSNNTINRIVIFTIDSPDVDEAQLRSDAQKRFDVAIPYPVQLISLECHKDCLDPSPYLSLVLESWGTMKLAYHALQAYYVQNSEDLDVFCDTTGCAFTFAVVKWFLPACKILAYVHYPTISTDMMSWEWSQSSKSVWKRQLKLVYFSMFAMAYGIVGSFADLVMVNSTWTYNHIRSLWWWCSDIDIVYPPCRVPSKEANSLQQDLRQKRKPIIVSVGQFRPEKDHRLQIEAFAHFLQTYGGSSNDEGGCRNKIDDVQLWLIGSCRNEQDQGRVKELQEFASQKGLLTNSTNDASAGNEHSKVAFKINLPYTELEESMKCAAVGIHTMRQEHFGIGIVEMMSAGLLTIAHNSGGPKTDIIEPNVTGFLATTSKEYADCIHKALSLDTDKSNDMRQKARLSSDRFSDSAFDEHLLKSLAKIQ